MWSHVPGKCMRTHACTQRLLQGADSSSGAAVQANFRKDCWFLVKFSGQGLIHGPIWCEQRASRFAWPGSSSNECARFVSRIALQSPCARQGSPHPLSI